MSFEDRDLRDPEPPIPQDEIERVRSKLHIAQDLHSTFRTGGWTHIKAMIEREAHAAHEGLEGTAHDMIQVARCREQLRLSRWILELEKTTNTEREKLADRLAELTTETEGDDEDG